MISHLSHGDAAVAERAFAAFRARMAAHTPVLELRDGIAELLAWLHGYRLKLALAANQPSTVLPLLDEAGIGHYFDHREVAGTHGYRKPDVRLFLRCCDDLGVRPEQCIMVGDRIDNDIAPARALGMRAVLFRTGRHCAQQPRAAAEVPHAEVHDVAGLRDALASLLEASR